MSKYISLDNLWKFSHLFFILLIILSCFYAIERVCYIDSAYMLFRMINQETMVAEGGRWINILPQLLPWIFIKTGLPLKVVILCFSFMYLMIPYFIFLLIGRFFNQKLIAVLFLLLMVISVNETFFDVVTETRYSLAFGALFLAFFLSERNMRFTTGSAIIFCGFFSHPIFLIYFLIIIFFCTLFNRKKGLTTYLLTGTVIFIVRYLAIPATPYENTLISEAFHNLSVTFKTSFIHNYFYGLLSTQFIYLICLFFLLVFLLVKSHKYLRLTGYIFILSVIYFLLCLVYSKGDSHMMIQKTLILFHFIIIIPIFFLWNTIPVILQKVFIILIFFSFFTALNGIKNTSDKYIARVEILKDFIAKLPAESDKFILRESQINHDELMATWALPHETILISHIYLKKNVSVKNFRERNDTLFYSKFPNAFRPAFGYPISCKNLNQNYFKMNETEPNIWLDSTYILHKNGVE